MNNTDQKRMQVTQEGLENLKKELKKLKEEKRPVAVERLARARSYGDLSENSEYTSSKEDLRLLDEQIAELEEAINSAKVVKKSSANGEIQVGSQVEVEVNGKKKDYKIVSEMEADPVNSKISASSPIGEALLGKKKGDKFKVTTPGGEVEYLVKKVS